MAGSSQPDVLVRLSAEGVQDVVNALKKVQNEARNTQSQSQGVIDSLTGISSAIRGIAAAAGVMIVAQQLKDAAAAGINFNQTLESAQLGIAAIIAAQAKLVDSNGNQLDGQAAYNAALQMSVELMQQLQQDGLTTAATTEQLVAAFQGGLSAALGNGITDLSQIRGLVVGIVQAAGAMQVPMDQLRQEITSILSGNIGADSTVAKNLGLTNEDIKQWKTAGTLVEELQKRLAPFQVSAEAASGSFAVLSSNVSEAFSKVAGESTKGLFDSLKTGFGKIFDSAIDKGGQLTTTMRPLTAILNDIGSSIGNGIVGAIESAIEGAKSLSEWIGKNEVTVRDWGTGLKSIAKQMGGLIGDVARLLGGITKTGVETGTMGVAWRTVAILVAGVRDGLKLMQGLVATVGYYTMSVFVEPLMMAVRGFGEAAMLVTGGKVGGGLVDLANGFENIREATKGFAKSTADDFKTGNTAVGRLLADMDKLTVSTTKAGEAAKKTGGETAKIAGLKNKPRDQGAENLQKARADLLQAQADNEMKILQAKNKLRDAEEKRQLEQGLLSLEKYYADRRAIITSEIDKERAVLQRKLTAAQGIPGVTDEQKVARQKAVASAETEITLAGISAQEKLANLESERLTKLREIGIQRLQFEQRMLEAQNQKNAAAEKGLQIEAEQLQLDLQRQGLSEQEARTKVQQYQQAQRNNMAADQAALASQQALQELEHARAQITTDQQAGKISQLEAEQRILDIERQRLPVLMQLAQAQLAAAQAAGDQGKVEAAQQQLDSLRQVQAGVQRAQFSFAQLRATATDTLQSSLAQGLVDAASGAKSFGDAMRSVASSVLASIQQMIAQFIALKIVKTIAGFSEGGLVGGGGGAVHAATGGYISGPGTATSDNIPAMLSNGEFVVRAAAVSQPGVLDMLHQLNGGLRVARSGAPRHYSDGGLVTPASPGAAGGDSSLTVALDKGLLLKELQTPEGQRVLVKLLATNRRAVRNSLGT